MEIESFLFDIGNVLVRFDFALAAAKIAPLSREGADPLAETADLFRALECGELGSGEFVRTAMGRLGYRGGEAEFVAAYQSIFSENAPMGAPVAGLAGRYPLHILSNTSGIHVEGLWRDFPIFQHFGTAVFSHEAGAMKPDDAIYETAIATLGIDPARTAYIDDLPDNIAAGERLGFRCHHYDPADHGAFLRWLGEIGCGDR